MWKHFFVSCGILFLSHASAFAHGNGDGHDISDPSGIQYDNISGDAMLRRSTCRVFGTDESYLHQAIGYHNDLIVDNGDGVVDRRCYWSLIFMSSYTMNLTSPLVFRGEPLRSVAESSGPEGVLPEGVLIDINTDTATPSGFVTFVLDARGLGDCPIRFDEGVKARLQHLTVIVDNPRKAFCRSDGTTAIYSSLNSGHIVTTDPSSQTETDRRYAVIDNSVTIQPALTFPEVGSGGSSGSGGYLGSGGIFGSSGSGGLSFGSGGLGGTGSGGSGGVSASGGGSGAGFGGNLGTGGGSGLGGQLGSGGATRSSAQTSNNTPVIYGDVTRVDPGGCNRL
ncbi:MAG: hypothetical protein IPJ69_07525 [Deltaproteobacteria bacterium]|nr:MAG: hypothetical protein IPJ69_07525 [Deltaproteobacteria bacterium]